MSLDKETKSNLVYIYIYIYIHEDHSINKVNFASGVGNRKYCLQLHLFPGNQQ